MSIRSATLNDVVEHCDRLIGQDRRHRPESAPIAAFDADGTLWGPDVAELLWDRLVAGKSLTRKASPSMARALRSVGGEPTGEVHGDYVRLADLHREGKCPEETMVRAMLQGLAGIREEDLYAHSEEAIASCADLRPIASGDSRKMVDQLRAMGFHVIVVSSSPRWAVETAVRSYGIEPRDILAGQVAVVGGVLTDGVIEPLPHGRGKIEAILKRFGAVPRISLGNALADLAMMTATSALRILVNPTDEMVVACDRIPGDTWALGLIGPPETSRRRQAAPGKPSRAARAAVEKKPRRPIADA